MWAYDAERRQGGGGHHEHDREARQQDVERDLVGGLAPLGAFDQSDHAIQKRLARLLGDQHHQFIRQQSGAARDGRAVAAGLTDDGCRLTGDGRLVDRTGALHHVAVGGDHLARAHQHVVAPLKVGRAHLLDRAGVGAAMGECGCTGGAQRVGLGLAASLGDRLGDVGEDHRQPQPERHDGGEPQRVTVAAKGRQHRDAGGDGRAQLDDEHHRVVDLMAGIELAERVLGGLPHDLGCKQLRRLAGIVAGWDGRCRSYRHEYAFGHVPVRSSARLSCRTFTPGSPKSPRNLPSVFWLIRCLTVVRGRFLTAATLGA